MKQLLSDLGDKQCPTVMPKRRKINERSLVIGLTFKLVTLSRRWYRERVSKHNRVVL